MDITQMTTAFECKIDYTHIDRTVECIKRARARMLRNLGESAYLIIHRRTDLQHGPDRDCICDPVIIGQHDHRPSVYFANEILNPVIH